MKTWRWCTLAGCGAFLCVACGSSFSASDGDEDADSTDDGIGQGDASASDGSKSDARAGKPDAAQDAPDAGNGDDGASDPDACGPGVSSAVCVAAMEQIALCSGGTVASCDCAYLKGSCETLAGDLSDAYKAAYVECTKTLTCEPLVVDDCAYNAVVDAGLTSQQTRLLTDYCMLCDPTNAACGDPGSSIRLFAAEFTDSITASLDTLCATKAELAPYIAKSCGATTQGPACCLEAFKTCETDRGLALGDPCDAGGSPDAALPPDASLPDAKLPPDTSLPDAKSVPDAPSPADGPSPKDVTLPDVGSTPPPDASSPRDAGKDAILMLPDVITILPDVIAVGL
jgi:hypothetical protein